MLLMAMAEVLLSIDPQARSAALAEELRKMHDDTGRLATLERELAHDAQGTLAGVRAAIQIWERSHSPQSETSSLRQEALREVSRLECALRAHRVELGCGSVRLAPVVDRAVARARARGAEVTLLPALIALGEECDLERAVRDVVEHSLGSDPARLLVVRAWQHDDTVVIDLTHPGGRAPVARERPGHLAQRAHHDPGIRARALDAAGGVR